MKDTILFIHGMFQNAKSWEQWVKFFCDREYACVAESWPLHEGDPAALRRNPPSDLGDLRLQTIIDRFVQIIGTLPSRPIVIGHSVGGLIAQKLVEMDLARAGVAISSVAPNRMLALDWGFFRNSVQITNPFVGDKPFEMTPEGFHQNFANTMSKVDSHRAFEETATHDSRNVLRDCMLDTGHIDLLRKHVPLLFVAAEKDEIIPPELCEKNAHAYEDVKSVTRYAVFPDRGHFICGEPKWEEVARYVADWLALTVAPGSDKSLSMTNRAARV